MAEQEKEYQPILPPAPDDEKPEEGFVPYCGSDEAETELPKSNKKFVLLISLIIVVVLLAFIMMFARKYNFYQSALNGLQFDYQQGEIVYNESIDSPGSLAASLSEQIGNRPVRVDAAMYLFDQKQNIQNIMTEYSYSHSADESILDVRTGSEKSLFMKHFTYRASSMGYQKKSGSDWKDDPDAYVPKLNEYFFGTQNHAGIRYGCEQSSEVNVDGKDYTCELWLMEDNSGPKTVYTTIYRYYSGSRLAGVRLLFDYDDLMEVYDIKNYVIG